MKLCNKQAEMEYHWKAQGEQKAWNFAGSKNQEGGRNGLEPRYVGVVITSVLSVVE
jgi:hypothetical protein